MHQAQSIRELLEDVRLMEDTILYLKNRVLRKQIAIEELLANLQRRQEQAEGEPEEVPLAKLIVQTIDLVLTNVNGEHFSYGEITRRCLDLRPQLPEEMVRKAVYNRLPFWRSRGMLMKVDDGFARTSNGFEIPDPAQPAPA